MTIKPAQGPFNHDLEIQETYATTQRTAAPPHQESLPYSAFSLAQKRWTIAIVAFAGWFSSLSSFIYFPAIPSIASDLDVSTERINLTVTAYLVMSGIFPSIVGNATDTLGRRPVFIVTLALHKIPVDQSKDHNLASFPVEEARLRIVKYFLVVCCLLIIGYGWSLQYRAHMAVPLVLQFFIGLTIQVFFTSASILLVDLHPEGPATTQAANNFVRCEMSAGMLALLDLLLVKLGPGWCFVLLAALVLVTIPLLYLLERRGMLWQQKSSSSTMTGPVEEAELGEENSELEKRLHS
ncbi:MFS general substrate transporter [Penicillium mononematosum]|uniref:MFS general substrate transporter n=1 Tax=Penicillium mononematosum TaxID=268346 RepID=UPI002549B056|nr:MFS general substrate transporter [Penicillium mononematosum]KAJ6186972.1 MFS general substrate transporter [Penicillium mononematosum]